MTVDEAAEPIDLARTADFRLGALTVSPPTGRVIAGGRAQRIQPRVMEVIVLLSRRAGRTVSRDELIDACWSGRIVSDNAVNRVLAQVRALARLTDPPPFVLEMVPKVGVRLLPGAPTGDPDALGAAPAPVPVDGGRPRRERRAAVLAGAIGVALALGAAGVWLAARALDAPATGRVHAPAFQPLSDDPGVRRTAAATSDELIRILSRGGVAAAAGDPGAGGAGDDAELQVIGTVGLADGDQVIDVRVLDRRTGLVLWTDRLVRSRKAADAAPNEAAAPIAAVLNCALVDRAEANIPVSTEAFGLYLNACAGVFLSDDNGQRMLAVARRLVKAAPRLAGAHAMRSIAAARVAVSGEAPGEAAALHAEARAAAERALELDPRTAKAYCGLTLNEGLLTGRMRQDWAAEARYLKAALSIDPDLAPARNEYATFLRATGRLRDAVAFTRASSANEDPRYGRDPRTAMLLAAQGDLAAAEAELRRREAQDRRRLDEVRATIAFWWGDPADALASAQGLDEATCLIPYLRELMAHRGGRVRGLPPACRRLDPTTRVRLLGRKGDVNGAFALIGAQMPGGPAFLYYPEMATVRDDPRFWRLAKDTGLLDYWRVSGRWPDFCAAPGQDCRTAAAGALAGRP